MDKILSASELHIAKLIKERDLDEAFKLILSSQKSKLYLHLRRMLGNHDDTNDVLQETFIRIWKNLDKFEGKSSISTWVYRIATNAALTHLNKEKKKNHVPLKDVHHPAAHSTAPSPEVIQKKLQKAMELLPPKQKQVFVLRYYEEMSYEEMAELTGTSQGALKASYHHAVKKIEAELRED